MQSKIQAIQPGSYYHIYSRGNNSQNIFFDQESYRYFLKLLRQYIEPVADIYAYCLLTNHFHLLIYAKENHNIVEKDLRYSTVDNPKIISASHQFSHFLNAYTQAVNKKFERTGSLFEKPFKRRQVTSEKYLKNLIWYIHNNPVKHGIAKRPENHKWSSYTPIISGAKSVLTSQNAFGIFGGLQAFISFHEERQNTLNIHKFIIE